MSMGEMTYVRRYIWDLADAFFFVMLCCKCNFNAKHTMLCLCGRCCFKLRIKYYITPLFWLFQSRDREAWPDGRWALEGQVHLWLRLPPRHGGEDVCDWPDVCSGANEHVHHRLHAHLLQVQQRFQYMIQCVLNWKWLYQNKRERRRNRKRKICNLPICWINIIQFPCDFECNLNTAYMHKNRDFRFF